MQDDDAKYNYDQKGYKTLNLHELKDSNSKVNLEWNPYFRDNKDFNEKEQDVKINFNTQEPINSDLSDDIYTKLFYQKSDNNFSKNINTSINPQERRYPTKQRKESPKKKLFVLKKVLLTSGVAISVFVLLFSFFLLGAPFFPHFLLMYQRSIDDTDGYKYKSEFITGEIQNNNLSIDSNKLKPIPVENTLVIPSIQVDAKIHEGENESTLDKGIWRKPNTSIPVSGGNTVLTAHRFMNVTGPNTFYALDKVEKNDQIFVFWKGQEYVYEVYENRVVKPTQLEIEENTQENIVTLYTCHPLWTSDERLVVRGKLIES